MTVWEYAAVELSIADRWTKSGSKEELSRFNENLLRFGAEGWELVEYQAIPVVGKWSDKIKSYAYLAISSALRGDSSRTRSEQPTIKSRILQDGTEIHHEPGQPLRSWWQRQVRDIKQAVIGRSPPTWAYYRQVVRGDRYDRTYVR